MMPKIALFGSCGKMGSGIAELLLQHPLQQLVCIDVNEPALLDLRGKLRKSLRTFAEKNMNRLRADVQNDPTLVSNEEIIDHFIENKMDKVICTTVLEEAKRAEWIFEAVSEDIELKVQLFRALPKYSLFFSNTSAIPIQELSRRSEREIIGFHFYNPPTLNKMLEIVVPDSLKSVAESLAKELKRTYVFAGDVPGFIGNGHFIRELKFALDLNLPPQEIDRICEEDLLRPFGIFKLAQFIGIPTVLAISKVMGVDCSKLSSLSLPKAPLKPHKVDPKSKPNLQNPTALKLLNHSKEIGKLLVQTGAAPDLKSVETVLKVGFQHPYGFEYATV